MLITLHEFTNTHWTEWRGYAQKSYYATFSGWIKVKVWSAPGAPVFPPAPGFPTADIKKVTSFSAFKMTCGLSLARKFTTLPSSYVTSDVYAG